MLVLRHSPERDPKGLAYRRAPIPVHFPVEAEVPETQRHLQLRTLLYLVLRHEYRGRHSIGSEQFVYWNASEPKRCLAPDVFVRLDAPHSAFASWKTWERGAPELAVEIVSDDDRSDKEWQAKLERYQELGVSELVRFDADAPPGERIRVWDRLEGDLVERVVEADVTPCRPLGLFWIVGAGLDCPVALRLARDAEGGELLRLPEEAEAQAREAEARAREAEARAEAMLNAALAEIERLKNGRG